MARMNEKQALALLKQEPAYHPFFSYWEQWAGLCSSNHALVVPREQTVSGSLEQVVMQLDTALFGQLKVFAAQPSSQLAVALSAFHLTLSYYTGRSSSIFLSGIMTGREPEYNASAETILCFDTAGKSSLKEILVHIGEQISSAIKFQDFPVNAFLGQESGCRMEELTNIRIASPVLKTKPVDLKQELQLEIVCETDTVKLNWSFYPGQFNRSYVEQLAGFVLQTLTFIITEKAAKEIGEAVLPGRKVITDSLALARGPGSEAGFTTFLQAFRETAAKRRTETAIVSGSESLSYAGLEDRTSRMAAYLRANYLSGSKGPVAIWLDQSEETIVAMLAVWKTGLPFLPLDTSAPFSRNSLILQESGAQLVITGMEQFTELASLGLPVFVPGLQTEYLQTDPENVERQPAPGDSAYIIYTSGSTGVPKGVVISHGSFVNYLHSIRHYFGKTETVCMPFFGSPAFDLNLTSIFAPLYFGGCVEIFGQEDVRERLVAVLASGRVNALKLTPSHLRLAESFAAHCPSLETIIAGGEELRPADVAVARKINPAIRIFNEYGPTEATVGCSVEEVTDDAGISIGRPMENAVVAVVNARQQLLPRGVVGELIIGGKGLAREYLNDPVKTASTFIAAPAGWAEAATDRFYLTGDLGYYDAAGRLHYLGRKDSQVKIRGFRIETGEIAAALNAFGSIGESAVIPVKRPDGSHLLVAYYTSDSKQEEAALTAFLSNKLPPYMVPARFIRLDRLPLTASGKLNIRGLPEPGSELDRKADKVLPADDQEKKMAAIWERILDIRPVGVTEAFFALGGDSIIAIRLLTEINQEFGVTLLVHDLFTHQTIRELLAWMNSQPAPEAAASQDQDVNYLLQLSDADRRLLPSGTTDLYPLSRIQMGMLYHTLADPEGMVYRNQHVYHLKGKLVIDRLAKAWELIVAKHDQLRTSFIGMSDGTYYQCVQENPGGEPEVIDLSASSDVEQENIIKKYMAADSRLGMQYRNGLLHHTGLFILGTDRYRMIVSIHHAIEDGWSFANLMTELFQVYSSLAKAPVERLPALRFSFGDYIRRYALQEKADMLLWWKEYLEDFLPLQPPPEDSGAAEEEGSEVRTLLPDITRKKLEKAAASLDVNLNVLCLTAFALWQRMMSGRQDVSFGLVGNTRPAVADGDKLFGCFLNTVPFRIHLDAESLGAMARATAEKYYEVRANDHVSLQEIMDHAPGLSGEALFHSYYNFIDFHVYDAILGAQENGEGYDKDELEIQHEPQEVINVAFALTVDSTLEGLGIQFQYQPGRYSKRTATAWLHSYLSVLEMLAEDPDRAWDQASVVYRLQPEHFDGRQEPATVPASPETIAAIWAKNRAAYSSLPAILCGDKVITYEAADEMMMKLAAAFARKKIQPGSHIMVLAGRSEWTPVLILGCMLAGMVYVPVDPEFPHERIRLIMNEAKPALVITEAGYRSLAEGADSLLLEELARETAVKTDFRTVSSPESPAYIMFTSGSTGVPKGVRLSHGNLLNFLPNMSTRFGFREGQRILALTNVVFDISLTELLFPLLCGGCTIVTRGDENRDPARLIAAGVKGKADILQTTPSMLKLLTEEDCDPLFGRLHCVMSGGEPYSTEAHEKLCTYPGLRLINVYGPTETTIWSTAADTREKITAGKPLHGESVYLLTDTLEPVPVGSVAEICIAGNGLALDYLGQESLTLSRFVLFRGKRVYRTGDLGRWLEDGSLLCLGRKDDQVKIRGHRIEPDEISSTLRLKLGYRDAYTTAFERNGQKELVAYLVTGETPDVLLLGNRLREFLPHYMIPEVFIAVTEIPLSPNGKVDKKRLPRAEASGSSSQEYTAPRTAAEKTITRIIGEVLGTDRVGVRDNFFSMGINSVKSIRIYRKLEQEYPGKLNISDLFSYATAEQLAARLEDRESSSLVSDSKGVEEFEF